MKNNGFSRFPKVSSELGKLRHPPLRSAGCSDRVEAARDALRRERRGDVSTEGSAGRAGVLDDAGEVDHAVDGGHLESS